MPGAGRQDCFALFVFSGRNSVPENTASSEAGSADMTGPEGNRNNLLAPRFSSLAPFRHKKALLVSEKGSSFWSAYGDGITNRLIHFVQGDAPALGPSVAEMLRFPRRVVPTRPGPKGTRTTCLLASSHLWRPATQNPSRKREGFNFGRGDRIAPPSSCFPGGTPFLKTLRQTCLLAGSTPVALSDTKKPFSLARRV